MSFFCVLCVFNWQNSHTMSPSEEHNKDFCENSTSKARSSCVSEICEISGCQEVLSILDVCELNGNLSR